MRRAASARLNLLLFQRSIQVYDAHMNWHCEVTETQLRINNVDYFMPVVTQ